MASFQLVFLGVTIVFSVGITSIVLVFSVSDDDVAAGGGLSHPSHFNFTVDDLMLGG